MPQSLITVTNVSKTYAFHLKNSWAGYSLRELMSDKIEAIKKMFIGNQKNEGKTFIALDSISFTIQRGEIVGIIGANGAGKSTLLKLLGRITVPTSGNIEMNGKVTSLIDVGSLFHQDMTGMENIYFSGVLLGMKRTEIQAKIHKIISFADINTFIDVPIKFYSAGMMARLSFAIAIFLEPEILIIDEALMVGDAKFQKKCVDYFIKLSRSGVTIIIASHDLELIEQISTSCIYLSSGKIIHHGNPKLVIQRYLADLEKSTAVVSMNKKTKEIQKEYASLLNMSLREWLLFHQNKIVFSHTKWMGIKTLKNPSDAWVYQEILYDIRPDIVVEIGSHHGGSTLFLAQMLELIGHGKVISVDIDRTHYRAIHPRIEIITGDSKDREVVEKVYTACLHKKVLIIYDSAHDAKSVTTNLNYYSDLVAMNSYFIVEDGIIDLFKAHDGIGSTQPGPLAAIIDFLHTHSDFIVDTSKERYLITYNPRGFLKRIQ